MSVVLILALKDLKQLIRNRMGTFWIFIFPVVMALFFGAIFGGSQSGAARKLSLAVVDEDGSEASQAFVERLRKSDALSVVNLDRAQAHESVRLGNRSAYLVIPAGFGESMPLFGRSPATLELGIDPTRKAEGGFLQGLLIQASFEGLRDQFMDPAKLRPQVADSLAEIGGGKAGLSETQQKVLVSFLQGLDSFLGEVNPKAYREKGPHLEPLKFQMIPMTEKRAAPRSAYEISFPQAILWALIACSTSFALALVRERMWGTFLRLRAAPLSRGQILHGKGLACFLAAITGILFLLILGRLACGVRLDHPVLLTLAIPCSAACFVGIMVFVSVLGKSDQAVSGAGWGILMIFSMLGGGMVPLFVMPAWMRTLSDISPVKWSILALEGAIWRDFSLAEMILPCAVLLAFGSFFAAVGLLRFARMERA
ncbi:MAG: ABC transporter permease [Acidobacteria bacterium]|nr:ABC transporter permease [Acidobacteriota bacterium]